MRTLLSVKVVAQCVEVFSSCNYGWLKVISMDMSVPTPFPIALLSELSKLLYKKMFNLICFFWWESERKNRRVSEKKRELEKESEQAYENKHKKEHKGKILNIFFKVLSQILISLYMSCISEGRMQWWLFSYSHPIFQHECPNFNINGFFCTICNANAVFLGNVTVPGTGSKLKKKIFFFLLPQLPSNRHWITSKAV